MKRFQVSSTQSGTARRSVRYTCAAMLLGLLALPALAAEDSAKLKLGKELFLKGSAPACAVCHTLNDAAAKGAIGPVLDELKPDANRVAAALRNGIGQMPSYKGKLTEDQIAALAVYVASATGAAKK